MEAAEEPLLNLKIEKGPLTGQSLEFKPGSKIQIGRVSRGNTICIKDAGISSKHLSIKFESGSWVITDLGSSNGTFLNTITVDPFRPVKLTDGDVIKLGELTSIKVNISAIRVVDPVEEVDGKGKITKTQRNARRKAAIDENSELGFGNCGAENSERMTSLKNEDIEVEKERKPSPRRTRGSRKVEKTENVVSEDVERAIKPSTRRTRGSKKVQSVKNGDDIVEEAEDVDVEKKRKPSPRRTRGSKKVESVKNGDDIVEEAEDIDVEKERKPSPRRTRGSKKVESVKNGDDIVEEAEDVGVEKERKPSPRRTRGSKKADNAKTVEKAKTSVPIDVEKEKVVCTRRTRGSRKEDVAESLHEKAGEDVELKQPEKGKRNTSRREESVRDCEAVVEKNADDGVKRNVLEEVAVKFGTHGCKGSSSNAGVNKTAAEMEKEVNLTKMTVGEWFDFLDVYLPQQIIEATEEMILGMKQNAEKCHEFMLQQKNAKGSDGK